MKVAIIGGGWAGLAAAVELAEAGVPIRLFEAARQLGGRARSVKAQGNVLDNGQHILIGAYRETLRLMRQVGADPGTLLRRLPLELKYPGSGFRLRLPRLPAPLHLAFGLMAAKGCPAGEKISAARFMRSLQASDYQLTADCSVAELLDRHSQTGKLRRFMWEPLCVAALNTPPQNASAQIFANVLRDTLGGSHSNTDLLLPCTDLDKLFPDAAAHFIEARGGEISLSARIDSIGRQGLAFTIDGETFDHVVLATAPQHAPSLLERHPETAAIAELIKSYRYEPIGTVYLGYPEEFRLPFPMLGLDDGKTDRLGQWVFDRGQLGGTNGVMGCVLSAAGAWDERDNAELAAALHAELQEALGRNLPQPLWQLVIRERRATFSCSPGLPRPSPRTPLRGLWLAGDYVCPDYPATLEGAARSGITAARGILDCR